jgi:hypothetical protein
VTLHGKKPEFVQDLGQGGGMILGEAWGGRCFGEFSGGAFDSGYMTSSSRTMIIVAMCDIGIVTV